MRHAPGPDARCTCGAQEVFYEDTSPRGYGCDATTTYSNTLDRLGFHIHPSHVVEFMSDYTYDHLTDADFARIRAWKVRQR